jgi:hypothetical protein
MCCAPSAPMEFPERLYAHVCVRRAIERTCVAHDVRPHTYNRVRGHIHPCIPCTNMPHYYALMRIGYALHLLDCLECGVVSKCCSNVLCSLCAYGVPGKAVRTCVCEKSDTAHVRSSRYAIPYIQPSATHAYVHADIPNTSTRACLARIPTFIPVHNAIVYTMHKRAPLLRTHTSRLCTALTGVFEAWSCGQVL